MFALNKYLSAGILFLAVSFVVIDLWSFEDCRDFAKKRLSHYISIYHISYQQRWQARPSWFIVSLGQAPCYNWPKAAAEGSGLRPISYPRNGRGPLPKAVGRAPLGFAAP